jgi:uncharacterized membrane protein YsdA (DUF1294 family)
MPDEIIKTEIAAQEDNFAASSRHERFLQRVAAKKAKLQQQSDRILTETDSFFMFWSKGKQNINLNKVHSDKYGKKMACRHIAAAQLFHNKNKFGASYHDAFESLTEIPFLNENIFDNANFIAGASYYCLININNIGHELAQLAANLRKGSELKILFHSENHMMSIKVINQGQDGFVIQFFDPNNTLVHKQAFFPNAKSISSLQMTDLLEKRFIDLYFPILNGFLAIYPDVKSARSFNNLQLFNFGNGITAQDQLHFGFALNSSYLVSTAIHNILTSGLNGKENLLMCKSANGIPVLYAGLYEGRSQAVGTYVKEVLTSDLSDDMKKNLLACKSSSGVPGLFRAMQYGHHQTVVTYIKEILASSLSDDLKEELLTCKSSAGVPGLFMALQNGHHQTVAAYIKEILASNLTDAQKERLLLCKRDDGSPGIFFALYKSHDKAVSAYFHQIHKLSPESISRIIIDLISYRDEKHVNNLLQAIVTDMPDFFHKLMDSNNPLLLQLLERLMCSSNEVSEALSSFMTIHHEIISNNAVTSETPTMRSYLCG